MPADRVRLNTWSPLEQPWDTPMDRDTQDMFAQSAVISGARATDAEITALLADNPVLFVNAQRLALR